MSRFPSGAGSAESWGTPCPTKITFAEMRDSGVRGIAPTTTAAIRSRSAAMYGPDMTCASLVMLPPLVSPFGSLSYLRLQTADGPPVRAEIQAALP
jgi:hypothetical protein